VRSRNKRRPLVGRPNRKNPMRDHLPTKRPSRKSPKASPGLHHVIGGSWSLGKQQCLCHHLRPMKKRTSKVGFRSVPGFSADATPGCLWPTVKLQHPSLRRTRSVARTLDFRGAFANWLGRPEAWELLRRWSAHKHRCTWDYVPGHGDFKMTKRMCASANRADQSLSSAFQTILYHTTSS
jgi:hypothetical protein